MGSARSPFNSRTRNHSDITASTPPRCVATRRRITGDEYDRKARELKGRQTELALRIEQHHKGEDEFRTALESLISVASQAASLFERSKTEQKRELIAFVFSNLRLRGKKLEFSLRSPFDLMVDRRSYEGWLGDRDSRRSIRRAWTLVRPSFLGNIGPKSGAVVSAIAIAGILFVCVFCGALLGMRLRRLLPDHHLSDNSKEIVRLGMGLVATMAALVLGLLVASANSSYQSQRSEIEHMSANLILLDSALAHYGPEAKEARALLRRTVALTFERIWPEADSRPSSLAASEATAAAAAFYDAVQGLSPQTDAQRRLQSQALQISADAAQTRWLLIAEQADSTIPMPFLVVLGLWLSALFASFGLFPPANATVIAALFVCALSVSGAIFLILELDRPFDGLIRISDASLRNVLAPLGQ